MELIDGHLHLGRRPADRSQYNPIDFFFRSLARALGPHAIAVVLSGTASDGALGICEIKTMEGITFAQDPSTAKYDGMPRAAIATQMVDVVASPSDIAAKVIEVSKHPYLAPHLEGERAPSIADEQLRRIFRLILPACGVNFSQYKTPTIVRRLFRRMALLRMLDVDTYIAYLESTPAEVVNLHNDMLIHVTRFFREPESFEFMARDVLPAIDLAEGQPLRMWVAGCATGEEVYSLAMIVHEALGDRLNRSHVQIFGTDVSESAQTANTARTRRRRRGRTSTPFPTPARTAGQETLPSEAEPVCSSVRGAASLELWTISRLLSETPAAADTSWPGPPDAARGPAPAAAAAGRVRSARFRR